MIVLDEQLNERSIREAIEGWDGRVTSIPELGWSGLSDDSILRVLRQHQGCTFVTINRGDFWRKQDGDPRCAIICLSLPTLQRFRTSDWIRGVFRLAPFQTQKSRCGHVIDVSEQDSGVPAVRYYRRLSGPISGPVPLP